MRVTPQQFVNQALQGAQRHNRQLLDLQRQGSSGIRVERPSDDPAAMRAILAQKSRDLRFDVNLENIQNAQSKLNGSVSELLAVRELFTQARDIALQANQFEYSDSLVREIDGLIDRLASIANSRDGDEFVFSGTSLHTEPVAISGSLEAGTFRAEYVGANERTEIAIGSLTVDVRHAGREIFFAQSRQATLYLGGTGAGPGSAIDSGTGFGELTVRHTGTTYAAGSGIAPGTSSLTGDTVIGAVGAHTLTISSAGTLSLNGGPAVAFSGTETDLRVAGPRGGVVYVDTTGIVPGFDGVVDVGGDGTLSTDQGATEIPITFSSNQAVVDSATGEVTHVDSQGIRVAGSEAVEYQGTVNAFEVLAALRATLANPEGLSNSEWRAAVDRRIVDFERLEDTLLNVIGEQSTTLENLDALKRRTEDLQLHTQSVISDYESADIADVALRLQNEQNLLQFTLAASVQLNNLSILDFLR